MSDYDSDYDEFEDELNDPGLDDWEEEEGFLEEKKQKQEEARAKANAKRAAEAAVKAQRLARLEAAKGNVEDIEEDDAAAQREFQDRLQQFEVEQEFDGDEGQGFEALPIASMEPATERELDILGKKLGKCFKTFRSSRFYFYALNLLLMQTCEKVEPDDMRLLASKLGAKAAMREKALKSKKDGNDAKAGKK